MQLMGTGFVNLVTTGPVSHQVIWMSIVDVQNLLVLYLWTTTQQ